MADISIAPDIKALEIPDDAWTRPFWEATATHSLIVPQCRDCGQFRWPPGPFCPGCQSQALDWVDAGTAILFSYIVMREEDAFTVPALVEFPAAGGIRLLAAVVGARVEELAIGAALTLDWNAAAGGTMVPIFRMARGTGQ